MDERSWDQRLFIFLLSCVHAGMVCMQADKRYPAEEASRHWNQTILNKTVLSLWHSYVQAECHLSLHTSDNLDAVVS